MAEQTLNWFESEDHAKTFKWAQKREGDQILYFEKLPFSLAIPFRTFFFGNGQISAIS